MIAISPLREASFFIHLNFVMQRRFSPIRKCLVVLVKMHTDIRHMIRKVQTAHHVHTTQNIVTLHVMWSPGVPRVSPWPPTSPRHRQHSAGGSCDNRRRGQSRKLCNASMEKCFTLHLFISNTYTVFLFWWFLLFVCLFLNFIWFFELILGLGGGSVGDGGFCCPLSNESGAYLVSRSPLT